MPTYAYACQKCGHEFELLQSITDRPRQRCPRCRGKVKRLVLPGGGLIFKGSGFYATDYRRKEEKTSAAEGQAAGKGKEAGGDGGGRPAGGAKGTAAAPKPGGGKGKPDAGSDR